MLLVPHDIAFNHSFFMVAPQLYACSVLHVSPLSPIITFECIYSPFSHSLIPRQGCFRHCVLPLEAGALVFGWSVFLVDFVLSSFFFLGSLVVSKTTVIDGPLCTGVERAGITGSKPKPIASTISQLTARLLMYERWGGCLTNGHCGFGVLVAIGDRRVVGHSRGKCGGVERNV